MNLNRIAILLLSALAATGCAKQGMPTGGKKDVTPPQTQRMTPPSGTLNSKSQNFYIEFDEYVVIKDAENNILVSPPMKQRPEFKTKGKGIMVTIKDTLQPNTTYLFQFKEAIADFNEGNLLPSLEYVFSTGDYIDSMTLSGKVVDALTMEADKDPVSVWLMDEERYLSAVNAMNDTNLAFPQPNYITRSDKEGGFRFNNIKPGNYRIVAVKDEDKNTVIGANETMAFLDSANNAVTMPAKKDTADTEGYKLIDNTSDKQSNNTTAQKPVTLRLSTPKTERQRLTSSNFKASGNVVITSLLPLQQPVIDDGGEKLTWRLNSSRDTLTLWTLNKECDSLQLIVNDPSGINDTLRLKWHSKKKTQKDLANTMPKINIMRFNTSTLPYYDTLSLIFVTPLDTTRCHLDSVAQIILLKDSSIEKCNAMLDRSGMKAMLLYHFRQGEKYLVGIRKDVFTDIYGTTNDSSHTAITVSKAEDYGNLTLNVEGKGKMIVELLDEKTKVLKRHFIDGDSKVLFDNIKPAKYRVRVIVDNNDNGEWDSGDFAIQRQPERVIYLDKTLEIRANWDFEEKLTIDS